MSSCFHDAATWCDEELLVGCRTLTYFQPICSAKTCSVVGVEALARGMDIGGALVSPQSLFAEAAEQGVTMPFELLCRQRAVATFAQRFSGDDSVLLFVNVNLGCSDGQDDVAQFLEMAHYWDVPPSRIIVEVLESRFDDTQRLAEILGRFRSHGFLLALDDVGAGHSNLDRVPLIGPDIIKVDRELVRNLHSDCQKQGVFKSLIYLGRCVGALVVAEGVETEPEAITALELGADYLQGFGITKPASPERLNLRQTETTLRALADQFKRYMVRKTSKRRLQHRQYNVLVNSLLCNLTCSPSADFTAVLDQTVRNFPVIECAYILDETGIQVTDTVCRPSLELDRNRAMFRPAPRGTDHSLKEYYYMLLDSELQKYTTEPYVSLATGRLCQTVSTCYRDDFANRLYVLCVDVKAC